jgi:hypothetical protein
MQLQQQRLQGMHVPHRVRGGSGGYSSSSRKLARQSAGQICNSSNLVVLQKAPGNC